MTVRQFIAIIVVVAVLNLADHFHGVSGRAGVFIALGVVGLLGAIWYERFRSRLRDGLAALDPEARDNVLVSLENSELRADALTDLDVDPPRVPLRRAVETFAYPPSHTRTMRWTMNLWIFLGGFLVVGSLSDRVLGTERFMASSEGWWELAGLALLFIAGASSSWWFMRGTMAIVRVTDEAIELQTPGRRVRRIAWADVTQARLGVLSRQLRIRSHDERIAVGDTIEGYGRLANIVATRLPGGRRMQGG